MVISAPLRYSRANSAIGTGSPFASERNSKSWFQICRKRSKLVGKPAQSHDIRVLRRADGLLGKPQPQQIAERLVGRPDWLGVDALGHDHVVVAQIAVP